MLTNEQSRDQAADPGMPALRLSLASEERAFAETMRQVPIPLLEQATGEAAVTDTEKFEEALRLLVVEVRDALEKHQNLADPRQRRGLANAFDRYCNVVAELHGSEE